MATDVHVQRFQLPEGSKLQRLTEDLPAVPFGTTQSFEQLLATAHLHQVAQLRRLHQLRKANEAQAALMSRLRAKTAKEEAHAAASEQHRRQMLNLQRTRNAELEVRRHKVNEMGSARTRAVKAAHEVKLRRQAEVAREAENHKALQVALAHQRAQEMDKKRLVAYRRHDEEVKKRRSALEKKEAEADQKHAEQLTVRHANDKARIDAQVEREMATTRLAHIKAEQEFVARRSYYQSKQERDEERLHVREEEMETLKAARAETSRLRGEYAKRRLEMKEFHDEQHRGVLRERTNEKTARGALRESQRQGLMDEMARLRKAAAVQESWLKDTYDRMQKTGRYEPPPELQQMEASGVFNLGQAFGPESRPLTRAGSRPATRPETPGPASHGGTMHLASLRAIIGQPASMQHLPERPTSALSGHGSSMQRPKTSRGKPSNGLSRPQTAGTLSSSFAGRFPVSSGTIPRPRALAVEKWLEQSLKPHTARPSTAPQLQDAQSSLHSTARSHHDAGHHYEVAASPRHLLLKELHEIEQLREQERRDILSQVTSEAERSRLETLFDEKRHESHARLEAMHSGASTPRPSKPAMNSTAKRIHFNGTVTGHHMASSESHHENQPSDEAAPAS